MSGYPDMWFEGCPPSVDLSSGPSRVVTDKPDPEFKARPVGFVAPDSDPIEPVEIDEPPRWEGDDS